MQYRFEQLDIVAHSMGGLVTRTFLSRHAQQMAPWRGTFVSLSTPWGGEASAETGVKHAPAVVPSWRDMQPDGAFMRDLFARPLPPGVDHVLLFGYRGSPGLMQKKNNDGTVTLESQLRGPAQAEARMVLGFDEDHVSILRSRRVIARVQSVLDHAMADPAAASAGRVTPTFRVSGGAASAPWLLLRRVPAPGDPVETIELPLTAHDSGRTLGPVPAGDYEASLVASAFGTTPRSRRITIAAGQTAAVQFELAPSGELVGWVGAPATDPGQPAGSLRPRFGGLDITAVVLHGPAGRRHVVPRKAGEADFEACHARDADDARDGAFCFFDLPEGDYELTITAKGFRPHTSRHRVVPGQPAPVAAIVMHPEVATALR